jgi:DNA uptake protein ComE-like DNA-binding protein
MSRARRSFVMVAVLVVVACAIFVVTGVLFLVHGDVAAGTEHARQVQARAIAWSGLQAIVARMEGERDRILDGALPDLDEQYVVFEDGDVAGVARLLPVAADGGLITAEAGKLDLNAVDAGTLAATGFVDEDLAAAIVAERAARGGRFESVADLLAIPGVTPEALWGPLDEIRPTDEAKSLERDLAERVAARLGGSAPRGLADLVTAFSVEPALQRSGEERFDVRDGWPDELDRALARKHGREAADAIRAALTAGGALEGDGAIVAALHARNVPIEQWPEVVDALTAEDGPFRFGRLDVSSAPLEALAALPGIGEEAAAQIVQRRTALSADERSSIVWPLIEGIIAPEAYDELAARITTRCWTYGVRLAAGTVTGGDPSGPIERPVIIDAVIDLAGDTPRIAYLREVTHLQVAAMLALSAPPEESDDDPQDSRRPAAPPEPDEAMDAPEDDGASTDAPPADAPRDEEDEPPPPDDPPATPPGEAPEVARGPADPSAAPATGERSDHPPPRRRLGRWQRPR